MVQRNRRGFTTYIYERQRQSPSPFSRQSPASPFPLQSRAGQPTSPFRSFMNVSSVESIFPRGVANRVSPFGRGLFGSLSGGISPFGTLASLRGRSMNPFQLFRPPATKVSAESPNQGDAVNLPEELAQWSDYIAEASSRLGVPQDVIAAIMYIESRGNASAVSPAGAVGLMQIMPNYHSHRAGKYGGTLDDPRVNILVGAEILKENFDRAKRMYGVDDDRAWEIAAAAYLGDWDWARGTYAGAADAHGTTGSKYVDLFRQYRNQFRASSTPGNIALWSVFGGAQHPITQHYGNVPDDPRIRQGYASNHGAHMGVDIGVAAGTPLYTPVDGEVVTAGEMGGYGIAVYLKTSFGYLLLGHLSSVTVKPGQRVKAGTLVGYSGNTGFSFGAHLHLEVRDHNGNHMDPRTIFKY